MHYKDMSRTVASEEARGGPESKSPLENESGQRGGEEYYDPTREDNIKGRNETRLALWEEHLKDPIGALDKVLKCAWKISIEGLGPKYFGEDAFSNTGRWLPPKFVDLGLRLAPLGPVG